MKRIVFLDYIRIFACFLVILVHASEHFYGVVGDGSLAGPQSFLADEADRLWVSIYDGFSRMSVPTVADIPCIAVATFVSSYLSVKLISYIPGSRWIVGC